MKTLLPLHPHKAVRVEARQQPIRGDLEKIRGRLLGRAAVQLAPFEVGGFARQKNRMPVGASFSELVVNCGRQRFGLPRVLSTLAGGLASNRMSKHP